MIQTITRNLTKETWNLGVSLWLSLYYRGSVRSVCVLNAGEPDVRWWRHTHHGRGTGAIVMHIIFDRFNSSEIDMFCAQNASCNAKKFELNQCPQLVCLDCALGTYTIEKVRRTPERHTTQYSNAYRRWDAKRSRTYQCNTHQHSPTFSATPPTPTSIHWKMTSRVLYFPKCF